MMTSRFHVLSCVLLPEIENVHVPSVSLLEMCTVSEGGMLSELSIQRNAHVSGTFSTGQMHMACNMNKNVNSSSTLILL
jgi:hypothetical protein